MKWQIDGVEYSVCPLCTEPMPEEQNICQNCKEQISKEMYELKASFDNSEEFNIEVADWLERQ